MKVVSHWGEQPGLLHPYRQEKKYESRHPTRVHWDPTVTKDFRDAYGIDDPVFTNSDFTVADRQFVGEQW